MQPINIQRRNIPVEHNADQIAAALAEPAVGLVFMPWGAAERGSIALGILKQCARNIGVDSDIHYLNIKLAEMMGVERYKGIVNSSALLPEWFFSYSLFGPGGSGMIKNSWEDLPTTPGGKLIQELLVEAGVTEEICQEVLALIPRYIDNCLTAIDWSKYKIVGFSTTFAQTISSLMLAKRIKERYPEVKIVFGGANVDSVMGFELIKAFDWVDYVVHGEAEKTFPKLVKNVLEESYFENVPGVSMRQGEDLIDGHATSNPLKDLNESPAPDYTDYYTQLDQYGLRKDLAIMLPFESARGCWWGEKAHCTFCGLNGSTMAFRKKDPLRVYDEIIGIASKYKCLSLEAVDNILELGYMEHLLPKLIDADLDLSIFYEVKASLSKKEIRLLSEAGVRTIQPGIESLSTEVLRIMRKGMTAIQNIQLLKWCFDFNILPLWNILYGFPGETAELYRDYPRIIRSIMHLHPPYSEGPIVFERFSPYHFEREKFKLKLRPSRAYPLLYPEQLMDYDNLAYYFDGEWEKEQDPEEYMAPAKEVIALWKETWKDRTVYFNYEKGPSFSTLFDNRPLKGGKELVPRRIKLNEIQSSIFTLCDQIQSIKTIQQMLEKRFESPPSLQQTEAMLNKFVDQGLIFREADRYLSLAVRRKYDYYPTGKSSPNGDENGKSSPNGNET